MVIGGGQAGLAAGFYIRRHGIDFTILDAQSAPGGAGNSGAQVAADLAGHAAQVRLVVSG